MRSSLFNCVKQADVDLLGKAARQYQKISKPAVVVTCAKTAGEILRQNMKTLVDGEPTIRSYRDVAAAFRVWDETANVYVGIPGDHPLRRKARQMDLVYQVNDVAFELEKQAGDVEKKFHNELASVISK